MTPAERQKRYREKHKDTPSERFRRRICETLEEFGTAWHFANQHAYRNEQGGWTVEERLLTQGEKLTKYLEPMLRVLGGEVLVTGSRPQRLGDEDRYRREREERDRKRAEWDAEFERRLAEAEEQGYEGKEARMAAFGTMVADLGRLVA
jgi:hypothetical protein